ncbi:ankyrin [Morchella conica CCBAS932]|uniref:Ankyrin n=1 Tax=Morchella conica CCBAS932 TaxID=1392247 RepID=A0A3N4KF32_9PEZI|nr:ankyrin [Morchella conica CCBAS932]
MRIPTILLEYAEHGSLDSFHRTKHYKTLSLGIRAKICRDVAEGLHALHESGIVHGDVKLDNVLIFDEYDDHGGRVAFGLRAKLTDFGFSVKKSDESCAETDQGPMWRLKGRTWPWNDPGWQSLRTWSQLEKSDVFSYGLLAWSVLTGEEIGNLFDLDGITIKDQLELRKTVDDMKDVILGRNAANSFLEEDTSVQLLTACLFDCALDPYVETRGTMGKVLEIWNTWYFGDPPSLSLPPGITIGPPVDVEDHKRVNFHRIVRKMTEFPLSIKQQYLKALTVLDDGEESSKAILFRAFAHLVGWGVERNPEESKRILDSEYRIADVAIFKAMFLPIATTEERNLAMVYGQKCEPYEQEIAIKLLFTVRTSPSCEPVAQLRKYFPFPITGIGNGIYGTMRCRTYRTWKYNIDREDHPINHQKERGGELYAHELQDIWTKQPTINPGIGHNELHFAVFSGFAEAIKIMIDSDDFERLSLESKDYNGDTPLLSACRHGLFTIAELLIKAGANVKARNSYGETTLHFLDDFDDPEELTEISALLFKHGAADLINANCEGRSYPLAPTSLMPNLKGTPLNTAVMRNNLVLIRILLKHGADPFGLSSPIDSPSPAKVAASGHFIEILELFWKANPSDRNWANPNNKLLLHAIGGLSEVQRIYFHATRAKEMMQRTLRFLLDRTVLSYGKITFDGRPLLHVAAEHGTPDIIRRHRYIQRYRTGHMTFSKSY